MKRNIRQGGQEVPANSGPAASVPGSIADAAEGAAFVLDSDDEAVRPAGHFDLFGLKSDIESISLYNSDIFRLKASRITLKGRVLGYFGPSPDSRLRKDKLRDFFQHFSINHVICLDSRRLLLAEGSPVRECYGPILDAKRFAACDELTAHNIIDYYRSMGVTVINSFAGVRFDLPDLWDLEHIFMHQKRGSALTGSVQKSIYQSLQCGEHLSQALHATALPVERSHQLVQELSEATFGTFRTSQVIERFVYFPSYHRMYAFLLCLQDCYKNDVSCYIHCASGAGRTALYLACLLMAITKLPYESEFGNVDQPLRTVPGALNGEWLHDIYPNVDTVEMEQFFANYINGFYQYLITLA